MLTSSLDPQTVRCGVRYLFAHGGTSATPRWVTTPTGPAEVEHRFDSIVDVDTMVRTDDPHSGGVGCEARGQPWAGLVAVMVALWTPSLTVTVRVIVTSVNPASRRRTAPSTMVSISGVMSSPYTYRSADSLGGEQHVDAAPGTEIEHGLAVGRLSNRGRVAAPEAGERGGVGQVSELAVVGGAPVARVRGRSTRTGWWSRSWPRPRRGLGPPGG
jgi:hypothetical protein